MTLKSKKNIRTKIVNNFTTLVQKIKIKSRNSVMTSQLEVVTLVTTYPFWVIF